MANNNVFFSKGIDYINMTDEQLIKLEKKHDEVAADVLIERYRECQGFKILYCRCRKGRYYSGRTDWVI